MKRKQKQLELFSVDDMYGCIGVKDELLAFLFGIPMGYQAGFRIG